MRPRLRGAKEAGRPRALREGTSIVSSTPVCCCRDGILLIAGAFCPLLRRRTRGPKAHPAGCEDAAEIAVLPSPLAPWKGAPLRVIVAAEKPLEGELSLIAPDGSVAAKSRERHDGPPYFWFAEVASPAAGTWHATLARDHAPAGVQHDHARHRRERRQAAGPHAAAGSLWPVRNTWNRATENLYSAWIAKLFDAPLDAELSWKAWHEVLRDRSRNFLFNYLGLGEDNVALACAPTAPTSSTSCAPISPSRWGCRSAIRIARAASAARRRSATSGSTSSIPRSRVRRRRPNKPPHPPPRPPRSRAEPDPACCSSCFPAGRAAAAAWPAPARRRSHLRRSRSGRGDVRRIFAGRRRRRPYRSRARRRRTTTTPISTPCR